MILCLSGLLIACTETYEEEDISYVKKAEVPIELYEEENILSTAEDETLKCESYNASTYVQGANSVKLQIDYYTGEFLNQFEYHFVFIDHEEPVDQNIIITTNISIFDFYFVALDYSEIGRTDGGTDRVGFATILYSIEELNPEESFIVKGFNLCADYHRGVVFSDENSQRHYFSIQQNNYDGSLFLSESEELYWRLLSQRNAVKGVLSTTQYSWESISVTSWRNPITLEPFEEIEGITYILSNEDANQVFMILSTTDAVEVLSPFHYERISCFPMFILEITFANGDIEIIYSTESGRGFYRFTDKVGRHGDPGYVFGTGEGNEVLFTILAAYF